MKKREEPQAAMEKVAVSIGSTVGKAVRAASTVADEIVLTAKKVGARLPKKRARRKALPRTKKVVGGRTGRVKTATRKSTRSAKSSARKAKPKRRTR